MSDETPKLAKLVPIEEQRAADLIGGITKLNEIVQRAEVTTPVQGA